MASKYTDNSHLILSSNLSPGFPDFQANMVPPFRVKLSNMEIRTFRIKIEYKGK